MTQGIVFDVKKYSIHDGPGIRTTFFLKGCPLSCWWCHNPESQSGLPAVSYRPERCIGCGACARSCPRGAIAPTPEGFAADPAKCDGCGACADACPSGARELCGRSWTPERVLGEAEKDRPFYDESGGGVTFSGGEPLMQPEFLTECLDRLGAVDLHRAVDTSGFADPRILRDVAERADLFLYDLKHMDPEKHRLYTGVDNSLILENLIALSRGGARVWIRIPLIPGVNDDPENLDATARFVAGLPRRVEQVSLLPYHASGRSKFARWGMEDRLGDLLPPTEHQLRASAGRIERYGLPVRIGG